MQPDPNTPGDKKDKSGKKTILGSLGVVGVLALKFKFYLMAAFKALSFLKFGGWMIGPIITIGFYAMFFGLPYAVAIFVILVIHEMGHWIWMKALGLEPKTPVFLPFVAYVAMTKLPPDEATRAWVALAGPLVGGVGSAILFWFGIQNNNSWMMAAGNTGFFLNLFQLVPAKPFDGGFIIQAISKWLLIPGTVILVGLTILFKSPILFFIAILSTISLFRQFVRHPSSSDDLRYKQAAAVSKESSPFGKTNTTSPFPNQIPEPARNQNAMSAADNTDDVYLEAMQPATLVQRILIAIAYIGLAGCMAWLYSLSSDELVVFLPHKQ